MDAPLVAYSQSTTYTPIKLPPVEEILREKGIDVDKGEIQTQPDGTLSYQGYRVILYIRDVFNHGHQETLPKYHLAECKTLQDMFRNNRQNRYVVANRDDGHFFVNHDRNGMRPTLKKLDVCQNCLSALNWNNFNTTAFGAGRRQMVQQFQLTDFFRKYPKDLIAARPGHTADTAPLNQYPENWQRISRVAKEMQNHQCQGCRISLSGTNARFLHLHHINGQRNDNRPANLEVLCVQCHAEQPQHSHMQRRPDYQEFLRRFSR